ncbi:MAG TPA: O-antigen ligase family protein [Candidatus Saccharimonadales bacterium]|nr:O-antigen ligase family protein [Candidatus Saccharimonadales bacterium]
MGLKFLNFVNSSIFILYLALSVITPLLFSTQNSELFEVPKMLFVYLIAILIGTLTLAKATAERKKPFALNTITLSFLVFIGIQLLSTIMSLDKFTSIFGYPTRLNGGLLSQFAYFTILVCALVNLNAQKAKKLLLATIISALMVALWGIPSHFGYDPNCLVLTGHLNANCWQIDFNPTLRIFSTMGQPNWLASYFILIIPPTIALTLATKNTRKKYLLATVAILTFIALLFTNSISGIIGFALSIVVFAVLLGINKLKKNSKILAAILVVILLVGLVFGKSIFRRISQSANTTSAGPTPSGQIRLIVWQGAVQVIKHYPLLGTGPETFAYSYYQFRPLAHNRTSEWNFFYNKAHNEFLNTFANLGIPGGIAYLLFLFFVLKTLLKGGLVNDNENLLVSKAVLASIVGYQASIFFGFSTVANQLVMFLEIAIALILTKQNSTKNLSLKFLNKPAQIFSLFIISLVGTFLLFFVVRLYLADIFITRAKSLNEPQSLIVFANALSVSPIQNPFYLSEAAYAFAQSALSSQDPELSDSLKNQSAKFAQESQKLSPKNILILRRLATTYIVLSSIDKNNYNNAQNIGNSIVALAPTDPQSYLSLAKVQVATEKNDSAKKSLEEALTLKPDYVEAQQLLQQLTIDK